jgi:hypothetical protein
MRAPGLKLLLEAHNRHAVMLSDGPFYTEFTGSLISCEVGLHNKLIQELGSWGDV